MKARLAALALLGTASLSACADSSAGHMADRAKKSLARDSAYEMVSVKEFWGDASFMKDCVPPNSAPPASLTIYFEVLPSGQLGSVTSEPDTAVSTCIKQHIIGRVFSKPPGSVPYVTKIEMAFRQ